MFNIVAYNHDLVTDSLTIKVFVQLKTNGNIIEDGGTFTKKQSGDAWLRELKKNYLTIKVENFILHQKYIIENSPGHKSLFEKKKAIAELQNYLTYACEKATLPEASKWCVFMYKHFEKILPSSTNPSYESSVEALNEIMLFAKAHEHGALIKKAS